jgi:hypothetical protein
VAVWYWRGVNISPVAVQVLAFGAGVGAGAVGGSVDGEPVAPGVDASVASAVGDRDALATVVGFRLVDATTVGLGEAPEVSTRPPVGRSPTKTANASAAVIADRTTTAPAAMAEARG